MRDAQSETSTIRSFYDDVLRRMWPTYVTGAYAAGMLHGNPPGTEFQTMPAAEQMASVLFTLTLLANLALVWWWDR